MYLQKVPQKSFGAESGADPLVRGMGPRIQIRIRTKISWFRNTDCLSNLLRNFEHFRRTEDGERSQIANKNTFTFPCELRYKVQVNKKGKGNRKSKMM
jgi:hypothetical protein